MLTAIKESLPTYRAKELQHFKHILQRFVAAGSDMPTALKIVDDEITRQANEHRDKYRDKAERQRVLDAVSARTDRPTVDWRPCNECVGVMVPAETVSKNRGEQSTFDQENGTLEIYVCQSCRKSIIKDGE